MGHLTTGTHPGKRAGRQFCVRASQSALNTEQTVPPPSASEHKEAVSQP